MALETICTPALIYLVFSIVQIIVDTGKGLYNTAFLKLVVTFIFTIFLNYLCERGLGAVSWIIVFVPFILMSIIISMLLLMLGLDPTTGKIKVNGEDPRIPTQKPINTSPREQQTNTSLLKNLEDDLKTVDYSAYQEIAELDKEVYAPKQRQSVPRPPTSSVSRPPASSVSRPPASRPPVSSVPTPKPYNIKKSAPFVSDAEKAFYDKLTPQNKTVFNQLSSDIRTKIDSMYSTLNITSDAVNNFPSDELNSEFETEFVKIK